MDNSLPMRVEKHHHSKSQPLTLALGVDPKCALKGHPEQSRPPWPPLWVQAADVCPPREEGLTPLESRVPFLPLSADQQRREASMPLGRSTSPFSELLYLSELPLTGICGPPTLSRSCSAPGPRCKAGSSHTSACS